MSGNLSPPFFEGIMGASFIDPSNWVLVEEWSTSNDDFGGKWDAGTPPTGGIWNTGTAPTYVTPTGGSFSWTPDGSKFILSSGAADQIAEYSLTTPFDPNTMSKTGGFVNTYGPDGHSMIAGSYILMNNGAGSSEYSGIKRYSSDGYYALPATWNQRHWIDYDLGDAQAGKLDTTGTSISTNYSIISRTGNRLLMTGELFGSGQYVANFVIESLDLPNASWTNDISIDSDPLSYNTDENQFSQLSSDDDTAYIYCVDAGNAYLITVTFDPDDGSLTSWDVGDAFDLTTTGITTAWFPNGPNHIYVDTSDPTFIWVSGRSAETYGYSLAKYRWK